MHWVGWVFTIIALVFSALFVLGVVEEIRRQNHGPSLEGAGPEDAEVKVPIGSSNFEMGTLSRFLLAATDGRMPGDVDSEHSLFPREAMDFLNAKYSEWAPEPWSKLPTPPGPFGSMSGESPSPIIRISLAMSGMDEMMQSILTGASTAPIELDLSFKVMKTRIWFGVPAVPSAQWQARGLDEIDNIEEALAIIEHVVSVYEYLATPKVQGDIRWIYNKVWAEIDVFQDAITGRAVSKNEKAPAYHLTKLWEEYMHNHLVHMDKQSRAFVFGHLKTLQELWKNRFLECFQSGRQLNDTQMTVKIDHYAMMILNKIYDLYVEADIYMRHRNEGYLLNGGIHSAFLKNHGDKNKCVQIYTDIETSRITMLRRGLQQTVDERAKQRESQIKTPAFMEPPNALVDREWAHKGLQPEIENPPRALIEGWVQQARSDDVQRFGFVIYRLDYSQDDTDWRPVTDIIEQRVSSGWEGVTGSEAVQSKAVLHWVDGRAESLPEGDVAAARSAFKSFTSLDSYPAGLDKDIFLAITPASLASFSSLDPSLPTISSINPFVVVAAAEGVHNSEASCSQKVAEPEPEPVPEHSSEKDWKAGYGGQFRIQDQLIWTDLYAMKSIGGQLMEEYWALAEQHPSKVYIGPTTGVRRRMWRELQA